MGLVGATVIFRLVHRKFGLFHWHRRSPAETLLNLHDSSWGATLDPCGSRWGCAARGSALRGRMVWGFQVGGASRAPCLAIVYMPIWAPLGRIIDLFCGCYWAIGAGCGAGLSCVPGAATMAPRGLLSMPVPWGCAVLGGCWRGVVSYCVLCSLCCLCERLLTVCTLCSYCVALRRLLSVAAIVS